MAPVIVVKKMLAIIKTADATAVVLTRNDDKGKSNRYLQVHEIPNSIVDRLKVKPRQHGITQKLIYLSFSTKMTVVDVKVLALIRKIDNTTLQVRADKYLGEIRRSIGWCHSSHPTLTHTVVLTRTLEQAMKEIFVSGKSARDFQAKISQYDPKKGKPAAQLSPNLPYHEREQNE